MCPPSTHILLLPHSILLPTIPVWPIRIDVPCCWCCCVVVVVFFFCCSGDFCGGVGKSKCRRKGKSCGALLVWYVFFFLFRNGFDACDEGRRLVQHHPLTVGVVQYGKCLPMRLQRAIRSVGGKRQKRRCPRAGMRMVVHRGMRGVRRVERRQGNRNAMR